jgi:hypothetical protein
MRVRPGKCFSKGALMSFRLRYDRSPVSFPTVLLSEFAQVAQQGPAFPRTAVKSALTAWNVDIPLEVHTLVDSLLLMERERRGSVDALRLPPLARTNGKISIWQGDITTLQIGAIVNAANEEMLG